MAQIECTGMINITSSAIANAKLSAFLWCTTDSIQAYLDNESTIRLGNNYSLATAKILENHQVYEVVSYLSSVYEIDDQAGCDILTVVVSKLTAAQIGIGRMAASMGMNLAEWAERLKNEAWSTLQRIFVSQSLPDDGYTTPKDVPFPRRIFLSKMRERTVVPDA